MSHETEWKSLYAARQLVLAELESYDKRMRALRPAVLDALGLRGLTDIQLYRELTK